MNADFYERGHVNGYSGFIVWHQKPWPMTGQFSQQTTGTSRGHAGRRAWVRKEEGTPVVVSYHVLVKLCGFMFLFSIFYFEQFQTYRKVERLVQQAIIYYSYKVQKLLLFCHICFSLYIYLFLSFSVFFFFGHTASLWTSFPDQGLNLHLWQWKYKS